MPYGKRRKGKHSGSGRSTPATGATPSDALKQDATATAATATSTTAETPSTTETAATIDFTTDDSTAASSADLILTSDKRRGVYECDYCHADISQLPRIRCAVCPDFDLCLDCFATTDHAAAVQRLKAAASAHTQLQQDGTAGGPSTGTSGVSSAAVNHDDTHGYRVCDCTRYPLFPSSRHVQASKANSVLAESVSAAALMALQTAATTTEDPVGGVAADGVTPAAAAANDDTTKASVESSEEQKEDSMDVDKESTMTADSDTKREETSDPLAETTADAPTTPSAPSKESTTTASVAANSDSNGDDDAAVSDVVVVQDDPRLVWTVEEDLRLLEGIRSHGLGNWSEISEAVSGQGSTGKTPRRCLERYFDDFLGQYGNILPPYMFSDEEEDADGDKEASETGGNEEETPRSSKRRAVMMRSPSSVSNTSMLNRKRLKALPTEAAEDYAQVWPEPYVPPDKGLVLAQEVGRDLAYRAELLYVKTTTAMESTEEVEKLRKDWAETRLNQPGGPTVLPPRPNDVMTLPGADLEGFMPRRGDFDVEWENDAEHAVADMEFLPGESAQDKQLKMQVLAIYSSKLEEREKRKQFVLSRGLYNYRKNHVEDQKLPRDERDLVYRMRLFERFHTPEEHKKFLDDILKAKRLRKEIAKLQTYRRLGIRTLVEAEKYELDKGRRQFHKAAHHQKESDAMKAEAASGASSAGEATKTGGSMADDFVSSSLWKQYRTGDRKVRKSLNRGANVDTSNDPKAGSSDKQACTDTAAPETEAKTDGNDPMQVDDPATAKGQDTAMGVDGSDQDVKQGNEQAEPVDDKEKDAAPTGDDDDDDPLAKLPKYNVLSKNEVALCRKVGLVPTEYLEVKKALIQECLSQGLLDSESSASSRRTLVKIDAVRRENVVDFMVKAGWISTKACSLPEAVVVVPTTATATAATAEVEA